MECISVPAGCQIASFSATFWHLGPGGEDPTSTETDEPAAHQGKVAVPTAQDQAAALLLSERLLFLAPGFFLLWLASYLSGAGNPIAKPASIVPIFADVVFGLAILGAGALASTSSFSRLRLRVAALLIVGVTTTFGATIAANPWYGTDTIALAHQAAELTLAGQNPYEATADPDELAARFGLPPSALTQFESGGQISRLLSYPALHHLLFVPALAAHVEDLRWVVLTFQIACGVLLWLAAPGPLRLVMLTLSLLNVDLAFGYAAGSLTDWLWVFPLMLASWGLYTGRMSVAGLTFGIACAIKQEPWVVAPFLGIWAWKTGAGQGRSGLRSLGQFAGLAALVFLAANGPYIVADAPAWTQGVLLPIVEPLIPHGFGLSLLTQAGLVPLPRIFYTVTAAAVAIVGLLTYAAFFPRLRPVTWLFPMVILWFTYRSFANYLVFWLPLLAQGLLLENRHPPGVRGESRAPRIPLRIVVGVIVALLAGALVIGTLGAAGAPSGLGVEVVGADTGDLDRLLSMDVRVTNDGKEAVQQPLFTVFWSSYPYGWHAEGPPSLDSGAAAIYHITPPDLTAAPTAGVTVSGQFIFPPIAIRATTGGPPYAVTRWQPRLARDSPLVNGSFGFWASPPRPAAPYGWDPVLKASPEAQPVVSPGPGEGVSLEVQRSNPDAAWAEAGLVQRVDLRACPTLRLSSDRSFDFQVSDGTSIIAVPGVELRAEGPSPPRVWLALTADTDERIYTLPTGELIATVHAPASPSTVDIPLSRLAAAGWIPPRDGMIKPFVAVFGAPGDFRLDVQQMSCVK